MHNDMKKFLTMILAGMMAMSLASCGGSKADSDVARQDKQAGAL